MAYATYTTRAIVCGSRDSHTSDKAYLLFTEDAGMLWATARSVREEKSKQRYALQDFSSIRVSLVKGKTGWRIGSVEAVGNVYMKAGAREARAGLTSVLQLLRRFLHGEEPHTSIFTDVMAVMSVMPTNEGADIPLLVEQFTLRLLWQLGYVAEHETYHELLHDPDWYQAPTILPPLAARAITRGLEVSHL